MTNKSANYAVLSIEVVSKTPSTVTYKLAHAPKSSRKFSWGATTGSDRMIVAQLEVGGRYFIRTSTDQYGTQHWTEARRIDRNGRMTSDPITVAVAKVKSRPQIRQDFLESILEY